MAELRSAHSRGDAVRTETGRRRHCAVVCFRVAVTWGFCEREGASVVTACGSGCGPARGFAGFWVDLASPSASMRDFFAEVVSCGVVLPGRTCGLFGSC